MGVRGRLFQVDDDYQVGECIAEYNAVGCGRSYALGSLYVTQDLPASVRVLKALEAAQHFSAGVREPFRLMGQDN